MMKKIQDLKKDQILESNKKERNFLEKKAEIEKQEKIELSKTVNNQ